MGPKFRLAIKAPGAEKGIQTFCTSMGQAEAVLKLYLDAGQPDGTTYSVHEAKEEMVVEGVVDRERELREKLAATLEIAAELEAEAVKKAGAVESNGGK